MTVSEPIAAELTRRLRLRQAPLVVLNCPPLEEVDVEPRPRARSRAIYQAAVGPGARLLDDLVEARARRRRGRRVASGCSAATDGRAAGFGLEPPVAPDELVAALAPFDIGLVIDRPETDNARLALPNKLFEYLMAGLAVVVPTSPAMARARRGGGRRASSTSPGRLGDVARRARGGSARASRRCAAARARAAVERYNAEAQRPALYAAWGL